MKPSRIVLILFVCTGPALSASCGPVSRGVAQPPTQERPSDALPGVSSERQKVNPDSPAKQLGGATNSGRLLYRAAFEKGPSGWTVGKDKPGGSFNVNVLGRRGEAVPPAWQATGGPAGGHVSSASPWYFDSNHGEFMWFYLALIGPMGEAWGSHRQMDLRDARLKITLRGHDMQLKGTSLYLWVQGNKGPYVSRAVYNPGDPLVNWA